jgi:hypothetical protein
MKRTAGLRCTICNHPARPQIDLAIATGLSKRAIAQRFQVSRDAVWRHAQAHLTAEMRAALATGREVLSTAPIRCCTCGNRHRDEKYFVLGSWAK